MRIAKIENNSVANGPGIRVVLWCQGCSLKCKGCHNKDTWDENQGDTYTANDNDYIIQLLKYKHISGLTLSGGHPLEPYNINECTELCREVKDAVPDKTIWLYTGWLWEDIKHIEIMNYIDVIVDGPYIEEERNISLPYCGSNNQRVINVKESLKSNKVILYKE